MIRQPAKIALLLALTAAAAGAVLCAQQPTTASNGSVTTKLFSSDMGFSYTYPSDWQVIDAQPMMPQVKADAEAHETDSDAKRASACTQVGFLIRKSQPVSALMTLMLPWDCYGTTLPDSALSGFGDGVLTGLGNTFTLGTPRTVSYKLGSHNMWDAQMSGTQKSNPSVSYNFEAVCALLKKGAVCWVALSTDNQQLQVLEQGQVAIEGDPLTPLVPPAAFNSAR